MASSSSISGSSVASSASYADIIDRCSIGLNDTGNATFSDEQIATWLNDAIRDCSQHFPRIRVQTISCSATDQDYDLNADFLGVLAVEYPTGQTPKAYLSRLPATHQDFGSGDGWYDIRARNDDTNRSELLISASPTAAQSIYVSYHGHHALISDPSSVSGENTVPPAHQHLLVKFVLWQGALFLTSAEQASPTSNSSLLMAQLSQNARRLEAAYHTAVRQALYAADGESRIQGWGSGVDGLARIYR